MENYESTILSQYANSPTISTIVNAFNQWIDPTVNIDLFYANMWDVQTAVGYGLDVWGKIVGVSRNLLVTGTSQYFGFAEAFTGPSGVVQPFGQAPFYNNIPTGTTVTLSDPAFRTLIMVKAATNISNCTSGQINAALTLLFGGEGRCYVLNAGNMTAQLTFEFLLTPLQIAIIQSGVLPRPSGVEYNIVMVPPPETTFGFNGTEFQPFNQGTFSG